MLEFLFNKVAVLGSTKQNLLHSRRVEDIFKACLEDVLKTNNCLLGQYFSYYTSTVALPINNNLAY